MNIYYSGALFSILDKRVILPHTFFFFPWGTVPTSRQSAIPDYQILTFDSFILKLYNFNIICDSSFVIFGSSLIFFSHLTVSSLYYVVPISHLTVFLSHLMVPFFFPTFDGSILTLCSSNITCDSFFSHIW